MEKVSGLEKKLIQTSKDVELLKVELLLLLLLNFTSLPLFLRTEAVVSVRQHLHWSLSVSPACSTFYSKPNTHSTKIFK